MTSPSLSSRLDRISLGLVAFLPLIMALANRSATAVVACGGACALGARFADGSWRGIIRRPRAPQMAVMAFMAWAAISIGWSHAPATSLFVMGEALLPFLGGVLLLVALPAVIPAAIVRLAAFAFAGACVLIIVELASGLAVRNMLGMRAATYIFNRPVMSLLLIYWPLAVQMARLGWRRYALMLGVLLIVTVEQATSGASMLGLLLALPAFLVTLWRRTLGIALVGLTLAASLLLAPVKGRILDAVMPSTLVERLASVHAADRIEIWQDFGAVVEARPLTGAGFGVSAKMAQAPFTASLPPERGRLLAAGHPHDGFLQIWAELGVIGALLAALNFVFLVRAIARLPTDMTAAAVAGTVAATVLVGVFHGAWQGWWIGLLMATALWASRRAETR